MGSTQSEGNGLVQWFCFESMIALDMLISEGFDSSPWARVRFPTCAEKFLT